MCDYGKKDNSAGIARQQETQRQARIQSGLGQINSIYGGGQYGVNPTSTWAKGTDYFLGNGTKLSEMTLADPHFMSWAKEHSLVDNNGKWKGVDNNLPLYDPHNEGVFGALFGGGGGPLFGSNNKAPMSLEQARNVYAKQNLLRQGLLFTELGKSTGFNDEFYNNRAQQYENFALPQLAEQYGQTRKDTVFNLANKGLLKSTAGNELSGSLEKERLRQQQGLADQGIQQSQQLRQQVEGQRSSLIAQLEASGDPTATSHQALATSQMFQAPGSYAPLGNMFRDWANTYLAKQYASAYSPLTGGMNPNQMQQQNNTPSIVGSPINYQK